MPTYLDNEEDQIQEKKFFESIISLTNELKKSTGDFRLHDWCSDYLLPEENIELSNLKLNFIKAELVPEFYNHGFMIFIKYNTSDRNED